MTHKHDATPQGMERAIALAKAASVCNPTFVWIPETRDCVMSGDGLPEAILTRGGFLICVNDVSRWVPNGSDDKVRDACGNCFDLPPNENITTL